MTFFSRLSDWWHGVATRSRASSSQEPTERLRIDGGVLVLSESTREIWRLPLDEVTLIGEYTTQDGPWLPDYFLVFIGGSPPARHDAPEEAWGKVFGDLCTSLGASLQLGLYNRTDFASRVLWPPELEGHRLFDFKRRRRPGWRRALDLILPLVEHRATAEVAAYCKLDAE